MADRGPGRRWRLVLSHLAVGALGILVSVSVLVASGYAPVRSTSPGTIILDNVQVDYFYLNGTPQVFGPNQQEVCSLCPLTLTGGTTFTIGTLLVQSMPSGSNTQLWFNATSPIPFEEWFCSYTGARPAGWPPTGCPFSTDWHQIPFSYGLQSGGELIVTYPLTLSIPDPAPSLPSGFDVQLVFTVATSPYVYSGS